MNMYKLVFSLLGLSVLFTLSGCGGSSDTAAISNSGSVSVELTDAPGDYSAVYVSIDEIRVHRAGDDDESEDEEHGEDLNTTDGADDDTYEHSDDLNTTESGWLTIASPHKTYNLLELQNGLSEELGEANVSAGKYTQLRLILGDEEDNGTNILGNPHPYAHYVIFADGSDVAELEVPSDVIKQKHNFEILPGSDIVLTIDFDANKSVLETGNGKYILKPVLGLMSEEDDHHDHDNDESEDEEEIETEDSETDDVNITQ